MVDTLKLARRLQDAGLERVIGAVALMLLVHLGAVWGARTMSITLEAAWRL